MKTNKIAVFAASLDPITIGHLWVIESASSLFDKVIIAVGKNPSKANKYTFSEEERIKMAKECTSHIKNVEVLSMQNYYLADFAKEVNANYLIRGIRNSSDFEIEQTIRNVNERIFPGLMSVFVIPPPELVEISSSFVKGLIGYNGWATVIEKYVHPLVKNKILEKFGENFISLRNEYFTCIKILSPNSTDKDIEILYKNLIENYSSFVYLDEKITIKRYYHNIDHVFSGLKFLIENKDLIKQNYCYENIVLAWIYHDIIYKINFNKNEELSADLCVQSLRSVGVKEENLKEIHRLIMLTKHKENPFDNDFLGNIIVDIDLISIANKEEFDKNSSLIRKEYSIYSDSEYSKGRIMFFESLLNKKERKVLRSDLFKNLNERAVENIEKQIQELKGVV